MPEILWQFNQFDPFQRHFTGGRFQWHLLLETHGRGDGDLRRELLADDPQVSDCMIDAAAVISSLPETLAYRRLQHEDAALRKQYADAQQTITALEARKAGSDIDSLPDLLEELQRNEARLPHIKAAQSILAGRLQTARTAAVRAGTEVVNDAHNACWHVMLEERQELLSALAEQASELLSKLAANDLKQVDLRSRLSPIFVGTAVDGRTPTPARALT